MAFLYKKAVFFTKYIFVRKLPFYVKILLFYTYKFSWKKKLHTLPLDHLTNPFIEDRLFSVTCKEGTGNNFICYAYWPAEVTHGSNCVLGNNRIAGLFTVLFISYASHNLLQQPKPSILSFIATFAQVENCMEYCSVLFIYFPKVISCNIRFNC